MIYAAAQHGRRGAAEICGRFVTSARRDDLPLAKPRRMVYVAKRTKRKQRGDSAETARGESS
ncbi:hypothetical protein CQW49_19190 [Methylosinus trichosporium OB3b]|uniref:Uncharacterized protein n=1 Tax=Methylosinus trichosporium (strain ATCC 35070 / NCIMB 11131 / UNIQEM 75 / OB3b) TaxID=595536 RepID=A0A2D2D426_METT3|nr:hypothetical protein CQW49_19190 [Methylosinus trichosporium OB3b]OBS52431.1 hypothetical protein A8B73_11275 [Methylosinus sp. 3S-1]